MERYEWQSVLQYFWAKGYDLAQGVPQGWLTAATLAGHSPEWVWAHARALPYRTGWTFQEPNGTNVHHLADVRMHPPGYETVVSRALHGAELGLRATLERLGWPTKFSIRQSLIASVTDWPRQLQLPPHYSSLTLSDPTEEWLRRYGPSALHYNPFAESTGIFPVALLCGLLWPGRFERAQSDIHRWSAFYHGAAWPAAWWIAKVITNLPWSRLMDSLELAVTKLPRRSQVRSFALDAWASYQNGDSYHEWFRGFCSKAHYYPATHVAPNSAIIVAALCWGQRNWDTIIATICDGGFDPINNSLVAGALANIAWPDMSTSPSMQDRSIGAMLEYLGANVVAKAHI